MMEHMLLVPPPVVFEHVSFDAGIAHDLVFCIHQDAVGFLWFGTMHGLVRYDGHEFVTFRHDPFDSTSMSCDDVVCVAEGAGGDLWMGTYGGGINRYDRAAGRFDRILADGPDSTSLSGGIVWDIAVAPDGGVWAATGRGVDRIDPRTLRVMQHRHDPERVESLGPGQPRSILIAREGALWVGLRGGGLDSLDAATGRFVHHRHSANDSTSIPSDVVLDLYQDRGGALWIGTTRGAAVRRALSGGFVRAGPDGGYGKTPDTWVSSAIEEDPDGTMWIGTGAGLLQHDPRAHTWSRWSHDPANPASLRGSSVVALCRDRSGVLWVSCYVAGLDRLVPAGRSIPRFGRDYAAADDERRRVLALCEDSRGTMWIGTAAGLVRRDGPGGAAHIYVAGPGNDTPLPGAVRAFAKDHDGGLWIGGPAGLCRRDPGRDRFDVFPVASDSTRARDATALLIDHAGELWVGTSAGLHRHDAHGEPVTAFHHDPADGASLADETVLSLFEDRRHRIWVGTYGGISRLDGERSSFTHFRQDARDPRSLVNNYVYAMHETEDGTLWLGTAGGLERWDESSASFHHVRERDGLANPVVVSILEDDRGALWLGTQLGLARFDPRSRRFASWDVADGLQSNLFFPGSSCRLHDGTLAFGGVEGYNAFHPDALHESDWAPPVALTKLSVAGRASPTWTDAAFARELRLSPKERVFSVEFASLDFRRPGKQRYAYRLEGLDREWIDAGSRRTATYSSVPPGRYTLRVRGMSTDGTWNETGAALAVRVDPPFWRTPAFLASVCVAIAAAALLLHRLRVRSRVRHALDVARARQEVREELRRRAASDFHDELGHRLARIGLFSELAARPSTRIPEDVQAALARIGEEARRLADDARDFLGVLGGEPGTLADLVSRLSRFGEQLFERTEAEFRCEGSFDAFEKIRVPAEDRRNLLSIFKEAMTNSLRHASCRRVSLHVAVLEDGFTISLEDDGCGFLRTTAASGQGLRNMEWRAERIEGTIRIASSPGGGTTVALTRRLGTAAQE